MQKFKSVNTRKRVQKKRKRRCRTQRFSTFQNFSVIRAKVHAGCVFTYRRATELYSNAVPALVKRNCSWKKGL